jgi:hypothetical protein
MTQLPIKFLLFAALLLAVRIAFPPVYKPVYEQKVDGFAERPHSVVFMGTSRTKCAVIPAYFDQLLQDKKISSYNFGIDMGLMQMTMDWSENLIDLNPSLRHILIEITGTQELDAIGHQLPGMRQRNAAGRPAIRDISSQVDRAVLWIFKPTMPQRESNYADHNRPLNDLIEPCVGGESSEAVVQVAAWRSRSIEQDAPIDGPYHLPEKDRARIMNFIEYAESRGVSVHFFVPPFIRREKEAEMIGAVYRFLPAKNKIAVNLKGPIYSKDNTADSGHTNLKGAFAFTQTLADEFAKAKPQK